MNTTVLSKLSNPKELLVTHILSEDYQLFYNTVRINQIIGNTESDVVKETVDSPNYDVLLQKIDLDGKVILLESCRSKDGSLLIGPLKFTQYLFNGLDIQELNSYNSNIANYGFSRKCNKWIFWNNKGIITSDDLELSLIELLKE